MSSKHKDRSLLEPGFFFSWIVTFIAMYLVSYLWHGVLLNDLSRITYPMHIFLMLVALVYFGISLSIVALTRLLPHISNLVVRGWLIGLGVGVFIYLIAFALGISFYANPSFKHIMFDLSWQMIEGSIGGILAAWSLRFFIGASVQKI